MERQRTNKKHKSGGFKSKKSNSVNQSKAKLDKAKQSKAWFIENHSNVDL